jgi:all-trans-retinol 13,14-reductase
VEIRAKKCVVSDAGFTKTFEICGATPPLIDPIAGAHQLALVHHKEVDPPLLPSLAFFYLFIGLDGTDNELGLLGQNIWHVADWSHDKNEAKLHSAASIEEATNLPPPLVFLSNQSAKDPDYSTRHPGKATVGMIAWTDARWFDQYKTTVNGERGEGYQDVKAKMTRALLEILHFHFPLTKGRIAFTDMGTPLSANKYLGRVSGEIYNLDHTENRFKTLNAQLALHPQTTIKNLYMTGQDVMAVSVEGATLGGCFAASRVSLLALLAAIPIAVACLPWVISISY